MGRGPRRHVKSEEDESEDEALPSMSPNTLKEHQLKMIQRADLCEDNADAIKTSDYSSRLRPYPAISLTRECNIKGTEAARVASENRAKTSKWQAFGLSDEAVDTLFTQKQVGDGNTHRNSLEQQKRQEEERLGHKLDLEDTYNDYGGGRRTGKRSASVHSRPPPAYSAQSVPTTRPPSAVPKESLFPKRKAVQARPWPPQAFESTPSMALIAKINQSLGKRSTDKPSAMYATPKVAANELNLKPCSLTLPAQSYGLNLVEDPALFMSSVKGKLGAWTQEEQTNAHETSTSDANASQDAAPPSSTEPTAQLKHMSTGRLDDPSIRRVPVGEFSFSIANVLAPGDISTHTDGAPGPAALSGFSTSTTNQVELLTGIQAVTNDLMGLGLPGAMASDDRLMPTAHGGADAAQTSQLSPSGSILDSPILDNVSSEVLAADNPKVVIINGHRYVLEEELLCLKEAIGTQTSSAATNAVPDFPSKPAPEAAPVLQPSLTSSTLAAAASIAIRPSRPVNPFAPREPLARNDTNIAAALVSSPIVKKDPGPPPTAAKPAALPSSVVTSNKTIHSKWADEPSSGLTNRPAAPVLRSPSSIIGDRKVFGHLSKEAAEGQKYDPLPPRVKPVAPKRFNQAPTPGLAMLLRDMAAAGHLNSAAAEDDEEL
ncbi:uncharacterized protein Z519_08293 [Cladophialophora bantiana CBS 173.52]|uniref:Uncharacterized protein n=1 Tax=Cladophialophora bantiana (strain ATCC 10958 / CBS 173.52 / CDC B-1940 / NIH 8579) TaxID=1442370 RepID=A0A0D2FY55_CLAB1|nr:uncharacterized protein Z519_08293 [Cladophialophora bantiana CBS 173.52]KIW91397.1 hypothetical protein Z519_08293 [Cladophialophora bantiana CBS 173.52]